MSSKDSRRGTARAPYDATRVATKREDPKGIVRTAVVCQDHPDGNSIDLVLPSGKLIARLNIYVHREEYQTIDVITAPEDRRPLVHVVNWHNGNGQKLEGQPIGTLAIMIHDPGTTIV